MNVVAVWASAQWPYGSLAPAALLGVIGQGVGYPLLALGYASAIALAATDAGRGAAWHLAIAAAIIAFQIVLSRWWLGRFRFGPAEWLWRWLTYRRRPIRAEAVAT